ncbi:ABC transporter permease [Cobetia amphilecti]|uniref:ABC transporter permease subunit n=1 Tax=Cobetia amphilecti TaxID=1055104 RepID=A0AAP4TWM9_9GAMM|nr:ABC transporter permease subunit [Cobetia amphilecti]MDO6671644.1 ABC transporter permease subunit [Cobetia amphilecti]
MNQVVEGLAPQRVGTVRRRRLDWPLRRVIGAAMVASLVLLALLGNLVIPGDPLEQHLYRALQGADAVGVSGTGEVITSAPLGYDHLGRSLYHRLVAALGLSLSIAAGAVILAAFSGISLGLLAAGRGGWAERLLSLVADSLLALPGLLLVLMVSVILPSTPLALWLGLSLVLWVEFFRLARATGRSVLASPGVEASRLLGFGAWYRFRHHLWPEMAPVMMTAMAFGMANALMAIAALGFVHVGIPEPTPELGTMMVELLPYWREAPFALLTPVLVTFLLLLGLLLMSGSKARTSTAADTLEGARP